jgi:hypothetical protein
MSGILTDADTAHSAAKTKTVYEHKKRYERKNTHHVYIFICIKKGRSVKRRTETREAGK